LALLSAAAFGAPQRAEAAALPVAGPLAAAGVPAAITEVRYYHHYRPVYHRHWHRPYYRPYYGHRYRPYYRPYYRHYYRPYYGYGYGCRTVRVWTAWGWRWKRRCW
jgi:hypothetical protein